MASATSCWYFLKVIPDVNSEKFKISRHIFIIKGVKSIIHSYPWSEISQFLTVVNTTGIPAGWGSSFLFIAKLLPAPLFIDLRDCLVDLHIEMLAQITHLKCRAYITIHQTLAKPAQGAPGFFAGPHHIVGLLGNGAVLHGKSCPLNRVLISGVGFKSI